MTMFRLWLTLFLSATLLILFGLPLAALAALPDTLKQDFAPVDGYIIMPVNGDYLVDIDASKGARPGDLLSVSQSGETIIHPITGEIIGTLNKNLAVLSITQIKSGYSYAKVVSGTVNLVKGTPIKRFVGLSARLSGKGASSAATYLELTTALPELDWQGLSAPEPGTKTAPTDLLFTLTDNKLEARNSLGQLLRSYQLNKISSGPALQSQAPRVGLSAAKVAASEPVAWQKQTQASASGLIDYESGKSGEKPIGSINAVTLMADFVATPDGLLLATTDGATLRVFRVTDRLLPVAEYRSSQKIHAVSWWQPTPETLYLAASGSEEEPPSASTTTETNPSSSILKLTDGVLSPVTDHLGYFLGTLDRNGDGRRETLLGQDLDLDIFYGRVVQLQLQGEQISSSAIDFKIPRPFPVQSSLTSDLTGNGTAETVTLSGGILRVYQSKKSIYQSKKELGGSISQLTYDTNPGQIDALFTTATFEVAPVAADIDGDGQLELVAISSEHPTFVYSGNLTNISETWLSVFKFKDGRFIKGRIGSTFDRPIQGLYAMKDQILLLTTGPVSDDDPHGSSLLLSIPLH